MGVSNQVEVDAQDGRHLYLIIWRLALGYKFSSILALSYQEIIATRVL